MVGSPTDGQENSSIIDLKIKQKAISVHDAESDKHLSSSIRVAGVIGQQKSAALTTFHRQHTD